MANRYWVGGTANWDATAGTKWATTSGGVGGAAVPGTGDDVFFDAASGTVVVTVTATANSLSLNFTGFTGTFAGTSTVNVFANLTYGAGMTLTHTGTIEFESTSTGRTVTSNGLTTNHRWLFKGIGGGWTLQDNVTKSTSSNTTGNIGLTNGTLDLNGKTLDLWSFSITGTATRALVMGACTLKIRSTSTGSSDGFALASTTNFTLTENTGTVQFTGTGGVFNGSTETWYAVTTTSVTGSLTIRGGGSYTNISMTGVAADKLAFLGFSASTTITGTLTVTGNSVTERVVIRSTLGSGQEVTLTAAAVSLTNVDIQDITGAGAATWSGTSLGNCGNTSGITFTSPVTRYWVGNGGSWSSTTHWSTSSGGASGASVPICHDTVIFDANSFSSASQTVTIDVQFLGKDVTFGDNNSPTYSFTGSSGDDSYFFGNVVFAPNATYIATSVTSFNLFGRSDSTLTTNGTVFDDTTGVDFLVDKGYDGSAAVVATCTLADNFTVGNGATVSISLLTGTLDFNDKDVRVGGLGIFSDGCLLKLGTGTITLIDNDNNGAQGATIHFNDFSDGVLDPFDAETSTIIIDTSFSTPGVDEMYIYVYADNTITYPFNKVILQGHGAVSTLIEVDFNSTLTIATFDVHSEQGAKTLSLDNEDAATTIAITNFYISGTPYSRTTLNSRISPTDAVEVNVTNSRIYFADIQDMNFTGSVTAYCSTSISGNTNLVLSTSALCKSNGASGASYCQPTIY